MIKNKWVYHGVLLLVLFLGGITFGLVVSEAAEEVTTFTLHKRLLLEAGQDSLFFETEGQMLGEHPLVNQETTQGINGVTFDVYDLSEYFYQQDLRGEAFLLSFADMSWIDEFQFFSQHCCNLNQPMTTQQTVSGEDGVATITLPTYTDEGEYRVYGFYEAELTEEASQLVGGVYSKALVIILPVLSVDTNEVMTDIHLYPKSYHLKNPPSGNDPEPEVPEETSDSQTPTSDSQIKESESSALKELQASRVTKENIKKERIGFLPKTGEGKALVSVFGVLLLGMATYFYKKNK